MVRQNGSFVRYQVYVITLQLKLFASAICNALLYRRNVSLWRWCSLALLASGVICAQIPPGASADAAFQMHGDKIKGLVALVTACRGFQLSLYHPSEDTLLCLDNQLTLASHSLFRSCRSCHRELSQEQRRLLAVGQKSCAFLRPDPWGLLTLTKVLESANLHSGTRIQFPGTLFEPKGLGDCHPTWLLPRLHSVIMAAVCQRLHWGFIGFLPVSRSEQTVAFRADSCCLCSVRYSGSLTKGFA